MKVKDDINFLQNPNWVVSKKKNLKHFVINNEIGSYEISTTSSFGLPLRLDKTVLYFLNHKLLNNKLEHTEVDTTRYEIAKNIFTNTNSFSQSKYQRIMISLERWKAVNLFFNGSFYEKGKYLDRHFSIVDGFDIDRTKRLIVKFNKSYIKQLRETEYYRILNFVEYRKLVIPVALRLYEILLKNFTTRSAFYIDVKVLSEKLTIQKRAYPSQVVATLEPAINEINNYTSLSVQFQYDKLSTLCIFKKLQRTIV